MARDTAILEITRTSLRTQAVAALRDAITSGELSPGEHVPEIDTANRLQISRGTMREALRTLQNEGLLIAGPRGRLQVRQMNAVELEQLFRVRGALEGLAARTIAEREDREEACELLRARAQQMGADAHSAIVDRVAADLAFHRELCVQAGNDILTHAWQALEGTIQLSITFAGVGRAEGNVNPASHLELVDIIASGDAERACAAVVAHMESAAATLLA